MIEMTKLSDNLILSEDPRPKRVFTRLVEVMSKSSDYIAT